MSNIEDELLTSERYWKSFIDVPGLEAGVLILQPGEADTQSPHQSDEIYFIVEGDGFLNIEGKEHQISPPQAFHVKKGENHKFHSNTVTIKAYYVLN